MKAPPDTESLERAILGALRSSIHAHGPITLENYTSAAKRILGQLPNASADGLARALAKRRWKDVSEEDRAKVAGAAAKSRWADMTAAQRSREMRRRRKLGLKRKKDAAGG